MPKKTISPLSFFKNKETPKGQFKQAANDNNGNMNSISKSLGSHFSSQQSQIKALSSNISNIEEKAQQTAKKVDATNSLLQQSINVQNNILKTLKTLVNKVEKIESSDGGNEKGGDSLASRLLKGMGIAAAAAFIGNNNIGSNEDQSAEKISTTDTFGSLSEEQKTAVLKAQTQWEGGLKAHPEENNPGNIMFGDFSKKYGATAGHKNDKITVAKFPTLEAGQKAQRDLWERDYKNMPLDKAIRKWVTGNENSNDVEPGYLKALFTAAGIKPQENKNSATPQQNIPNQTPGSASSSTTPSSSVNKEDTSNTNSEGGIVKENGGITTIRTPISKREFEVATPYAKNFLGFVTDLENSGYKIKEIGGLRRGDSRWHGKGMAIDINPTDNPMVENKGGIIQRWDQPGKQVGSEYQNSKYGFGFGKDNFGSLNVSAMAQKWGLGWGGDWKSKSDTMHFSAGPNEGGEGGQSAANIGTIPTGSASQTQSPFSMRNTGMGGINPMRTPLASIGGMIGGRQGAAIGGLAGMLLPAIQNILGSMQGDNQTGVMQPGTNYEQAKAKSTAIDRAAISRETQTQTTETPKQQQSEQQTPQQSNQVTQTQTDTRDKPEWFGDFRAGLKHAYLDFDGKMIYI
jgi:hypothetical protein